MFPEKKLLLEIFFLATIHYIGCCTKISCSVCFLFIIMIYPFQIQFISISYLIRIHFRSNLYPLHICMRCFVYFQTLSTTYYIDIISNTYLIHIHFRSNLYPLHILLYQNKLLCVFPVYTPDSDLIIHLLHGYYTKDISNSYPFQIKIISITCTVVPK